ncbi:acetylornithine aminotransferase [Salinisphaera sp. PC39]|uniref:aspartate aminotransferase family protein n=1 Tax=Salinisphaera sp. PC39 TaxID=1304156 RepID=UPI003341AF9C
MTRSHLIPTYNRQPVSFIRGDGVWLFDKTGDRYLDALAGIAVSSLGHGHPALTAAIANQSRRLIHTSNLYEIPRQEALATTLCGHAEMAAAFFCNSGTEANEAAIKLARLYGHRRGVETPRIAVMEGAFHGRTLAALSATGNARAQEGFGPMPEGFVRVPYGDSEAVAALADDPAICAVLVEPIQGEGGVRVPPDGYLSELRAICDANDWLLMYDEVQTGVGRTGAWFAHQHEDAPPDVMTLAKGLGGGMPVGAMLVDGPATDLLAPGNHGTTFGGNPLACAAALSVLETISADKLLANATEVGEYIRDSLRRRLDGVEGVRDIRGRGLMIGIELDRPCGELVAAARDRRVLINVTAERVIRLLPPLIMTAGQADTVIEAVGDLTADFLAAG